MPGMADDGSGRAARDAPADRSGRVARGAPPGGPEGAARRASPGGSGDVVRGGPADRSGEAAGGAPHHGSGEVGRDARRNGAGAGGVSLPRGFGAGSAAIGGEPGELALLERIDAFCDTVPRRWASACDDGPLRLFVRDGAGWPFSARPVPGGPAVTAADVERMRARQRAADITEAFEWVLATAPTMLHAVSDAGLPVQRCPLLVLDGEPVPVTLPTGCDMRLLGPADGDLAATTHAVAAVTAVAFGGLVPPPPTAADLRLLQDDLAAGAVARVLVTGPDGPVAAGSAQRCGDVVELVGIATTRRARGRGLGGAVTAALADAARGAGAGMVFLAAGDDAAARVYERVGFRRVGECGIAEPAR